MGNGIRNKYCRKVFFNPNRTRAKSGKKYINTIECYIKLLKREQKEGPTKWIINAKEVVNAKIKKYGINDSMIKNVMDSKGIK